MGIEPTALPGQDNMLPLHHRGKLRGADLNCRAIGYEPTACFHTRLPRTALFEIESKFPGPKPDVLPLDDRANASGAI